MESIIIDVREKDEFEAEHVEHSLNLPLSTFQKQAPALLRNLSGKPMTILCRSGKRAELAASQIKSLAPQATFAVFPGGILEWKNQGKPTIAAKKGHFPIMRQVQIVAGSLVLTGALLAHFVNPLFVLLSGFVGAGLLFAGITGFCGMAILLGKMPWNQVKGV